MEDGRGNREGGEEKNEDDEVMISKRGRYGWKRRLGVRNSGLNS